MAAYVVVEVDVHDPERYEDYKRLAPPAIAAYGGRYLARGGETDLFEGEPAPNRIVILEFENLDRARAFIDSEEYREARALRNAVATSRIIAVEGL